MMFQINTEVKHGDLGGIIGLPTLFMVNLSSPFVIEHCRSDESHHDCRKCNGQILPNICFCDIGQQCNNDAPRKEKCSWCKQHCPCLHNGKCTCDKTAADLRCKCPEGYDGLYCENIPYRTCKLDIVTTESEHCEISRNETCFIYSQDGSKLKCTISKVSKTGLFCIRK
ncbi:CD339 [Mytilus edulis]|uniref:JAG1 n=1 Tax=Mytilus edulis TaxID=6550 RepID=A0A8S3RU00_MYTED|nr:CD339 [Mytilus edulis]